MAESEKGDSSTGKAKGKTSLIDEDISNDFLSSWKSMSMTGGDDMDFNFEPVTKGNKKPFDFGKLDMDFSLDGEFGKVSSFKMDMSDLDFSSSPKKSTKSTKKPEDESSKGNRRAKHDEFSFSFDFNGLDDFSLDAPSTKERKKPSTEKSCKVGSTNEIECEDLPRQVANDNGATDDTISKRSLSEDAASSKPEVLVDGEGNIDASPPHSPSKSTIVVDHIPLKETQISSLEKNVSVNSQETNEREDLGHKTSSRNSYAERRAHDLDSIPETNLSKSISLPAAMELANADTCSETRTSFTTKGTDKENHLIERPSSQQSHAELTVKDQSATSLLVKTSTNSSFPEEMEICSPNRKLNDGSSEACTDSGELPLAAVLKLDTEKLKTDKLSPQCLKDETNISNEKNGFGDDSSNDKLKLNVKPSSTSVLDTLPSETRLNAVTQRSALKVLSASFGRPQASDVNPSACTKVSMNEDLVSENTNNNADANAVSREKEKNLNVKSKNEMGVEKVPYDGQAMKDGLLLESEKNVKDAESSRFKIPPSVPPEGETKFGNKDHADFKNKISSIMTLQKSNTSEVNKHSSLRIGKKLPTLPNLKISRNITTNKHLPSPIVEQNAKPVGIPGKSLRSQAMAKMVPPIDAEKQRHSSPSLKRKLSEVADVGPTKLRQSRHLSPGENRMPKELSAREVEDEVHKQGILLEESRKNVTAEPLTSKIDFRQEQTMEDLGFISMVESDANVEKAEACTKQLELICNMLKKKHEEAKELLVRALVNNNNLLMLDHPIYEEKIRVVQRFADRLMSKKLEAGA